MSEPLTSIDCGTFDKQETQTLHDSKPKKTRTRKRSIAIQLQQALDDAARAMTADISVQKLIQTRLDCLLKMQARERHDKLNRALAEVASLQSENERLREIAKPTVRPMTPAEQVLAKYEQEKQGGRAS